MATRALASGLAWTLGLLGPILSRSRVISFELGLTLFLLGGLMGIACIAWLIRNRRKGQRWDYELAGGALLGVLGPLALAYGVTSTASAQDVSTSFESPPRFTVLEPLDPKPPEAVYSPATIEALKATFPTLKQAELRYKPVMVYGRLWHVARTMPGWKVEHADLKNMKLEGVARSPLLGVPTQFVIQISPAKSGSRVDIRSRSQVPFSSFGENARVVGKFLGEMRRGWVCGIPASKSKSKSKTAKKTPGTDS